MMMELLLATVLACSDSEGLIENVMNSKQTTVEKHEIIEMIKTNTEVGCYEGSEHDS